MSQNMDKQELEKFGKLASIWWDPQGELKTLHQINPLRLQYIQQHTELANQSAIDIGCGGGILTESLAKSGAKTTGIDMTKPVIDTAKLHLHESNLDIRYLVTTAEEISTQETGQYDVVTCLEMLEHVPDPKSIVQACAKLLKPGGKLFLSTINRNPKSYVFAILGAEYLLKLLPKNTHDFSKFIKPSELGSWLRDEGLSIKDMRGISYQPFSETFSLTDNISVNYLVYAQKD